MTGWTPFEPGIIKTSVEEIMRRHDDIDRETATEYYKKLMEDKVWLNHLYQVNISDHGDFWHLSIKRRDKEVIRDWRHLQWIKNELVGEENEGLELFPAESRLVDTVNQYHLWVLKDPKARIPVGYNERLVYDDLPEKSNTKQRRF